MSKIKKVLVAEDISIINAGVEQALQEQEIDNISFVQYCDDAYLHLKKAVQEENAFDLLITDLSFSEDYRKGNLNEGVDLIKKIREEKIPIKILVFSIENRREFVKNIIETESVEAFVSKGRNDKKDLIEAIQALKQNKKYISPQLKTRLQQKNAIEIDNYDVNLLTYLADGKNQAEISKCFKAENISPSSISAIEKRINTLKIYFRAKNSVNLIAKAKDIGII
ncbi:response regulator [Mesonia maritima]|uniref:DNA-binding NarL/FixJ family response regulator n=1 Tax=Mesonia maritima TaxID=1793873 RepID=A0ABU1K5V3_9FLAO|nr:response regulator [Mesonia maritima]MDR6300998.1 DNA-binding NarL/FixJ family response regulator [Mesonia maritima]